MRTAIASRKPARLRRPSRSLPTAIELASTSGALTRTYGYDNAGNTTSFTGVSFTYNNRGRMKSSTKSGVTTNYTYNALGQLIKKGTGTLYYYDEAGHILGVYNSSGTLIEEIVWLGDIPLATLRPKAGGGIDIYYIHTDHLNTPRLITASVGRQRALALGCGPVRWRDGEQQSGGCWRVRVQPAVPGADLLRGDGAALQLLQGL